VGQSFGRRATDWELKGVPVRIEIGPRDLASGQVTLVRRDRAEKQPVPVDGVRAAVEALLVEVQADLLARATAERDARTADASTLDDAAEAAQTGICRVPWDVLRGEGEARLAERAVTVRCLQRPDGALPASDDEADLVAYVARSY
jgi:prolyl-tRNA synthetase